jgi:predicted PurR-regulated permease PerM
MKKAGNQPAGDLTLNNPQIWQAIAAVVAAFAALFGGLYAIVTRPIAAQILGMQTSIPAQMLGMQTSIQAQLTDIQARLLRIENKLDTHEQRITRLEERTSPLRR